MTAEQRNAFLAELAVSGNLTFAALAARVDLNAALQARMASPEFEQSWRSAQRRARHAFDLRRPGAAPLP